MMIKDCFPRIICNNILLLSYVILAAVLVQELYRHNVLLAAEVSNLMQLAAPAVQTFMMPLIQNVESVIILVLLVALARRQAVFLVNQDLP